MSTTQNSFLSWRTSHKSNTRVMCASGGKTSGHARIHTIRSSFSWDSAFHPVLQRGRLLLHSTLERFPASVHWDSRFTLCVYSLTMRVDMAEPNKLLHETTGMVSRCATICKVKGKWNYQTAKCQTENQQNESREQMFTRRLWAAVAQGGTAGCTLISGFAVQSPALPVHMWRWSGQRLAWQLRWRFVCFVRGQSVLSVNVEKGYISAVHLLCAP